MNHREAFAKTQRLENFPKNPETAFVNHSSESIKHAPDSEQVSYNFEKYSRVITYL